MTTQRKRRGGGEEVRERKEWEGRLKNAYSTTHTHTFTGREEKKKKNGREKNGSNKQAAHQRRRHALQKPENDSPPHLHGPEPKESIKARKNVISTAPPLLSIDSHFLPKTKTHKATLFHTHTPRGPREFNSLGV